MTNEYHFITHWRVSGEAGRVFDLISEPLGYPRWWSTVYLNVQELQPGNELGVGREFQLHTKGRLPYTLCWQSRAVEVRRPHRLVISATGDFNGRGIWTVQQEETYTNISFDWKLRAEKPLIRYLSWLLKPVFAANHRWAMQEGLRGLRSELGQ